MQFLKRSVELLGVYPKDTKVLVGRGTCTPMFIAALSTIAKLWREPKCPLTDEWIKKMCYTHTHTHTHSHWNITQPSKTEILPFAVMWIELDCIMLREISQSEKDKYHMTSLIYGI